MKNSVNFENGEYVFNGYFVLNEVAEVHRQLRNNWLQGSGDIIINLDGVEKADSSILALLLEWKTLAIKQGRNLKINALPPTLVTLSEMSGVDKLLLG